MAVESAKHDVKVSFGQDFAIMGGARIEVSADGKKVVFALSSIMTLAVAGGAKAFYERERVALDYLQQVEKSYDLPFPPNTRFICVAHVTAESNLLIKGLLKHGEVTVIPKGTLEKPADVKAMKGMPISFVDKANLPEGKLRQFSEGLDPEDRENSTIKDLLKNPELAIELLKQYSKPGETLVILDIGGYFSHTLPDIELASKGQHPAGYRLDREILGVTELTANGEHKHSLTAEHTTVPVVSFATSKAKQPENGDVGPDCLSATRLIMEQIPELREMAHDKQSIYGVLGIGNVGAQIPPFLKEEYGITARVNDISSEKMDWARREGYEPLRKADLIATSDVLCVAPASPILSLSEIKTMKDGAVLTFVTSIDDVVKDYKNLRRYPSTSVHDANGVEICRKYNIDGKMLNLVANGKSPNFYLNHGIAPNVMLSLSAVVPSLEMLLNGKNPPPTGVINKLPLAVQDNLLNNWRRTYPQASRLALEKMPYLASAHALGRLAPSLAMNTLS